MSLSKFFGRLHVGKELADTVGFNPYHTRIDANSSGSFRVGNNSYVDLASNDYLGLACDQRLHKAMTDAVRQFGASMCGTPIACGTSGLFSRLEQRLANFTGLEATVLFPSCYQANFGLFPAIAGPEDLILVDHYAHASLIQGIKAVGCRVKPFLHNNPEHLKKLLTKSSRFRHCIVVTESVFSTEGSIAPFREITNLCSEYGAIPVIDDSHGIGVIGQTGRGILEHQKIKDYKGIYTASLGKALGNSGGVIAGPPQVVEYLKYSCPGLIYSTALSPAAAGGLLCAIDIIENEFEGIKERMWGNTRRLTNSLQKHDFAVAKGEAPITSVLCGSAEQTIRLAKSLYEKEILATPFIPPSVSPGQGCVRMIAGAGISQNTIDQIGSVFGTIQHPANQELK